ncbi:MAG: hypothetical protein ACKVOW_14095 [Chitinophagaceae bacterium]
MKKIIATIIFLLAIILVQAQTNKKPSRPVPKYDTIIIKHVEKQNNKPIAKAVANIEIVIPTPEFINQPYYYDKDDNRLTKLENGIAQLITKKKSLGLKGAKQFFSMTDPGSRVRFTARTNISFLIKTSGDIIDFTSYIKLYKFIATDQKREVTITSKEGVLNDKEEAKGKQISFSIKQVSKENYMIQFTEQLEAGEYGFVWVKNMELKEFNVFAFGIDWKKSD